ncbi:MAG: hypothetical protein EOP04_27055 [Proteobacteria bacterium]|nr:MAG: hypothetical protein EOP04_27055 [Pseudomonadota bacterium]
MDQSLYMLPPGSTIGVCARDESSAKIEDLVIAGINTWVEAAGRDPKRLKVVKSCSGDRVLELKRPEGKVDYYGRVNPLINGSNLVDVPDHWAGYWTANHEMGHLFGFGHIFERTISIMNSEDNGRFMNGGYLSSYDVAEIRSLLENPVFAKVNKLWAAPATVEAKSCVGADEVTVYPHATVTTYEGDTYTCNQGRWDFSAGITETPALSPISSMVFTLTEGPYYDFIHEKYEITPTFLKKEYSHAQMAAAISHPRVDIKQCQLNTTQFNDLTEKMKYLSTDVTSAVDNNTTLSSAVIALKENGKYSAVEKDIKNPKVKAFQVILEDILNDCPGN